jgi:hypothetical protein
MSVLRVAQVGTATAQAAIEAVEEFGVDTDTLTIRLGVMQLLQIQQEGMEPEEGEMPLLEAYANWIETALRYYAPDSDTSVREYARAAALLSAELLVADEPVTIQENSGSPAS